MTYKSGVLEDTIRLVMNNQSIIEGKRVTKDEVIALALRDFMEKQKKIIKNAVQNCTNKKL